MIVAAIIETLREEADELRAVNAELSEARRNLEARLNAELREAGAEVERLKAALRDMVELIVDLRASQAECYPEVKRARAALTRGKE